jgi:hypothetical protein
MWATAALLATAASWAPLAVAQANLGAVVDAGGRRLSGDEFKRDVVGKVMRGTGTTPVGATTTSTGTGTVELVYLSAGGIRGSAQMGVLGNPLAGPSRGGGAGPGGGASFGLEGSWSIDERERVCTSMRMGAVVLAPRCQYWYAYENKYFLSDSDSDRSARLTSYQTQQ